jgi:hypothetical protein
VPLAQRRRKNGKLDDLAFGNPALFCQRDALGLKRLQPLGNDTLGQ